MRVFNRQPFLIANLSFNFYDLAKQENISYIDAAKLLIEEAQLCGVDAVLFDVYNVDNFISNDAEYFTLTGDISQYEFFSKYEKLGIGEFRQLAQFCQDIGMIFIPAPLDFESVDLLDEFVGMYKISSSDITNIPFIEHVATKNKPVLLSTGASTLKEIKDAIKSIEDVSSCDIVIMHSVISHPTEYSDANLLMIKDLSQNFPDCEIGYCDYTEADENMLVLSVAYSYGANVIEKHFTFDKKFDNPVNNFSMDPDDVIKFKNNILFLSRINGRKNKQPLICESSARSNIRKSVVAKNDISKGDIIKKSDLIFKRPAKGISPSQVDDIIGKPACRDISKDTFITFDMIND